MTVKTIKDKYAIATRAMFEGGWSSMYHVVSSLPDDLFDELFGWSSKDEPDEECEGGSCTIGD